MSKPNIIDPREFGSLTEDDLKPVKSDPESLFASNENIMQFNHFYQKGKGDYATLLKIKLQNQISDLLKQPDTAYRNAYIDGVKRAINLID